MSALFKKEMRTFFATPVGYVLIAAFLFIMNLLFYLNNIRYAYSDITYLFQWVIIILTIFAPLLTMRSFSEEYHNKTDQLLLTSPVSISGIVLGKFFALCIIYLICIAGTFFWPIILGTFSTLNFASVFGNYISVFFAGIAFLALGIFISSLTENQTFAAIASFLVFLAFFLTNIFSSSSAVGLLAQIISSISLFGRYSLFQQGLFPLDDIVFYISFTALFLFLTVRVIEKKRWA